MKSRSAEVGEGRVGAGAWPKPQGAARRHPTAPWEDIDSEHRTSDSVARRLPTRSANEWVVPVGERLIAEIRQFQRQLGAVGGWLFATERGPTEPMGRHVFARLLEKAEDAGKVAKAGGVALARLPPEVGDRTKAPTDGRRGCGRRLDRAQRRCRRAISSRPTTCCSP